MDGGHSKAKEMSLPPLIRYNILPNIPEARRNTLRGSTSAGSGGGAPGSVGYDGRILVSSTGVSPDEVSLWTKGSLDDLLSQEKAYQLFRNFLNESLAVENLNFLEAVGEYKSANEADRNEIGRQIYENFADSINVSDYQKKSMKDAIDSNNCGPDVFEICRKHVHRLLETDIYPRFKTSQIFYNFVASCATFEQVNGWRKGLDALLSDQFGCWQFRKYLRKIRAEENLRFWEAVQEYKRMATIKDTELVNRAVEIKKQFLMEQSGSEVHIPSKVKQAIDISIERARNKVRDGRGSNVNKPEEQPERQPSVAVKKPLKPKVPQVRELKSKDPKRQNLLIDECLFDDALNYATEVLRNDPYNRFILSKDYTDLLRSLSPNGIIFSDLKSSAVENSRKKSPAVNGQSGGRLLPKVRQQRESLSSSAASNKMKRQQTLNINNNNDGLLLTKSFNGKTTTQSIGLSNGKSQNSTAAIRGNRSSSISHSSNQYI